MLILALDTATSAVTVAVHDGAHSLAESSTLGDRGHGEQLAPAIERVMADAGRDLGEVTDLVCGVGPGPFTGLRVGVVTARVLGLALGLPVRGVVSLDALAHAAVRDAGPPADGPLVVATDARRKEVYWAEYDVAGADVVRRGDPEVSRPAELPARLRGRPGVGRGPVLYPEAFGPALPPLDVSAAALAELAAIRLRDGGELLEPEPLYLRRPDARPSAPAPVAT